MRQLMALVGAVSLSAGPCMAMQHVSRLRPGAACFQLTVGPLRSRQSSACAHGQLHLGLRQAQTAGRAQGSRRSPHFQRHCSMSGNPDREVLDVDKSSLGMSESSAGAGESSGKTWLEALMGDAVFMQVLAWSSFALLLYAVKPFYGVIAGTFVMSFVGNSVVAMWERTSERIQAWAAGQGVDIPRPPRKMLAAAYCLMMLTVLSIGSCITVPIVFDSWRYLKSVLLSDNPYVELANSMYSMLGPEATSRVESLLATLFGEPSRGALNSLGRVSDAPALTCQLQQSLKGYVAASLPFFNKILKGGSQVFAQVALGLGCVLPRWPSHDELSSSRLSANFPELEEERRRRRRRRAVGWTAYQRSELSI